MNDADKPRGPHVRRPAASATWEYDHRWGRSLGDSTTLRVTRVADGALTIAYGKTSIEIRKELVVIVAEMVAAAAVWTDSPGVTSAPIQPTPDEETPA